MRLLKKAQSTIEFATITALILGGIYLMGPLLVRNISGYYKWMEDQAENTITEEIQQAPPTGFDLPSCECEDFRLCGCGTGAPGHCPKTKEYWCKNCFPPGCEYNLLILFGTEVFQCRDQVGCPATCCDEWIPNGICGGPCVDPEEMEHTRNCGEGCSETECKRHTNCVFKCSLPCGNASCDLGTPCKDLGDPDDEKNLPSGLSYTAVSACTPAKCEMKVPLIMTVSSGSPPQWPPTPSNSPSCDQIDATQQLFAFCPTDYTVIAGGMTTIPIWSFPNLPPDLCNGGAVFDIDWIVNVPDLAANHWRCAASNWDPVCYATCLRDDAIMPTGIIDNLVQVVATSQINQVTTAFCPVGTVVVSGGISTLMRQGWTWPQPLPPPPIPGDDPNITWFVSRPSPTDNGWECGLNDYTADCSAFCATIP